MAYQTYCSSRRHDPHDGYLGRWVSRSPGFGESLFRYTTRMRSEANREKLLAFVEAIGRAATSPGRIYLVGGSTSLLLGIRDRTIDIDIKLDPEPGGVFEAIARLKESLDLNIELASPDQFVPALSGWRDRSEFVARHGSVEFFHFDFYTQALAKIRRGNKTDLLDADSYVRLGKVNPHRLKNLYLEIHPELVRYPAIDVADLDGEVEAFVSRFSENEGE